MSTETTTSPILELRSVRKSFGHVVALDGVSFSLRPGEVTALVGDNGAGKSTLVRIMSGFHVPTSGEVLIDGEAVSLPSPRHAIDAGVSTVYQDLGLVDSRSVANNIYLGREPMRFGVLLDHRRMYTDGRALLDQLHIRIPSVRATVAELSGGQRQAVAIARALSHDTRVVLLDEPTAALGVEQTAMVGQQIRDLRAQGKAVLLISHDLEQVFQVADRIVVLRRGRRAAWLDAAATDREHVVGLITGAIAGEERTEDES